MAKLTDKVATTLPGPAQGKADVIHWDDDLKGFGLRILASGRRSWLVRYRIGGKQSVLGLGTVSERRAAKAREEAGRILAGRRLGQDERTVVEARKAAASKPVALTMGKLVETYLAAKEREQKPRTFIETKRHLEAHAKPLHPLAVEKMTRANVADHLAEIEGSSGPVAANRVRSSLSACFAWGIAEGKVHHNPVNGTRKREERTRERVLTEGELRAIWHATNDASDHSRIVRLLLLTAQRRGEVGGMEWAELDFTARVWTIPGGRTKNGQEHVVPLSDAAVAVLGQIVRREGRELVFGEGEGPFSGWSRCKERLDGRAGVAAWTPHDLRRTAITVMVEKLGVDPHIAEAVLNHISGHKAGVAGVYNRASYLPQKRKALANWGEWIEREVAAHDATLPGALCPPAASRPRAGA